MNMTRIKKRFVSTFMFMVCTVHAATLVQNYRSHHTLLELPNKLFYNGQLVAAAKQDLVCPPEWSLAAQSSTVRPFADLTTASASVQRSTRGN